MPVSMLIATLALRPTPPVNTRRSVLVSGGLAAVTLPAVTLPASAGLPIDPIGAYGKIGDGPKGAVPPNPNKPNTGIQLLREVFDGGFPESALLSWYEEHLTPDFQASFADGKVVLDRQAYLAVTASILKSFPDFTYTREGPISYNDSPTQVTWTLIAKGTHSGAPFSPLEGVPAVSAKQPPVACVNDPEKVLVTFASGSGLKKIAKLRVTAKPGGRGFSGPIGFYLQAGGDASKLPAPP